jgi:hypothetical protein
MRLKVVRGSEPIVPQIIFLALAIDGTDIATWRVALVGDPKIEKKSTFCKGCKLAACTSVIAVGFAASTTGNRKSLIAPIADIVSDATYTI